MTVSVFVGTSVDGFIARANGDLDFLPEGGGEPHGYNEFIASVDAIVIGRNTFEKVLTFGAWPYGGKRVVETESEETDFDCSTGDCGDAAIYLHRRRNRAASVELAAATAFRLAPDYLLAGDWTSGAVPNPFRRR